MAKQLVNPIERHIEKAIVGVAGLVLLGAIARYLVTSPNQIDLGVHGQDPFEHRVGSLAHFLTAQT